MDNNERKYKFYDKNTNTSYDDLTKEEFEVLQYYYRKEKYMLNEQHFFAETYTATDVANDKSVPEDLIFKDEGTNVETEAIGKDILTNMLNNLSDEERTVVTLCVLGGYTEREVAVIMSKHPSALRRIRLRAQKKMREYLEESGISDYASAKNALSGKAVSAVMDKMFPLNDKQE